MPKEIEIISLTDRWSPELNSFRDRIYSQLCENRFSRQSFSSRSEVDKLMPDGLNEVREELWKYSDQKWVKTNFVRIECALYKGSVASMSGSGFYKGGLLRAGMHLFTIPSERRVVRNLQFHKGGFFERQIQFASESGCRAVFISIYPHSKKLQSHFLNLAKRRLSPDGGPDHYLQYLVPWPDMMPLNNVNQHILFYPLTPEFQFDGSPLNPVSK